jgi:hypothetical protein
MKFAQALLCVVTLGAVTTVFGCAPAYHSYSDCYVPCRYFAPQPLPYVCYHECVCHSCPASDYLGVLPTIAPDALDVPDSDSETN